MVIQHIWLAVCEGMTTHQLIEAKKDQDGPNEGAAQISCRCTRSLLIVKRGTGLLLKPGQVWHGCRVDKEQAMRWPVCTSREGDPLDAPSHLGEASQLWVDLDRGDMCAGGQASQRMPALMKSHCQHLR